MATIIKKAALATTTYISRMLKTNGMNRIPAIFQRIVPPQPLHREIVPPQALQLRILNVQGQAPQEALIHNEQNQVANLHATNTDVRTPEALFESDADENSPPHPLSIDDLLVDEAPIDARSFSANGFPIIDALADPLLGKARGEEHQNAEINRHVSVSSLSSDESQADQELLSNISSQLLDDRVFDQDMLAFNEQIILTPHSQFLDSPLQKNETNVRGAYLHSISTDNIVRQADLSPSPDDSMIIDVEADYQNIASSPIIDSTVTRSLEQKKITTPRNSGQPLSQAMEDDDIEISQISTDDDLQEEMPLGFSRRAKINTSSENKPASKDDLQGRIPLGYLHMSARGYLQTSGQDISRGAERNTPRKNKPAAKPAWR